ncbi:hypothetical protein BYT27DRAFT_6449985 [Phlegmacium glaucopus]|nr:hypothetical protein BYT27DRAFT_6449985 [Phlegmacium glaucopus]
MTRTARAAYPRAVIKDRSESRSGLDPSIRKSGAGHHNWGSLADEAHLEAAAIDDEGLEERETEVLPVSTSSLDSNSSTRSVSPPRQPENTRILTDEEVEKARNFRKNAFKADEIDLTAIARTSSAVSTSPPPKSPIVRRPGQDNKQIPIENSMIVLVLKVVESALRPEIPLLLRKEYNF